MAALLLREDLEAIAAAAEAEIMKSGRPNDQKVVTAAFVKAAVNAVQHRVAMRIGELRMEVERAARARASTDELLADMDARLARLEAR